MNITSLYEKLEGLAARLPAGLQSSVLREVSPIKTLFLQQRPPRLLLLGDRSASRSALVNAIFGQAAATPEEDQVQDGGWQIFASPQGRLRVLDARRPVALSLVRRALAAEPADLCLYLQGSPGAAGGQADDLQRLREVLATDATRPQAKPTPTFGVVAEVAAEAAESARHGLHAALETSAGTPAPDHVIGTFVLSQGPEEVHKFAAALAAQLPSEAKLEMARLSGVIELQRELAGLLIKATAAVCGLVGTEPIPLADFPILTALQSTMVTGIVEISGRKLSKKVIAEWLAAVGANIGMGLILREGSRAALKFLPFWGNMVSGGIAAAGTYAVGRAASAYFIEGVTLADAQRLFRQSRKTPERLPGRPPQP